jgi:3-hydroxyacyl-CoA dehydrogenase
MSKRIIKRVAVLGSGVMGSRIACHFAGAGIQVLLLDMETKQADDALNAAVKSNPSPVYSKSALRLINTGNFNDNLPQVNNCDWIIEVVVERIDVKKSLFEKVDTHRKPGTLVTSNTSGIPIHMMAEGRSDDFRKHFCGTHFFNPPRYLRLLEIIPTAETDKEVVNFLLNFGDIRLGKTTVLCKDTPAFIANRIGVFGIMSIFRLLDELDLTIDEVEALTGPLIGRPKSATFRTADVVGIDTLVNVAKGVYANRPADEAREVFAIPSWLQKMVDNKWLGDKSGQGFFKKIKSEKGEKEILTLDLKTETYSPRKKIKFPSTESARAIDDVKQRLKLLVAAKDKAGEFLRRFHYGLFSYISHRIPEITDELYRLDDAMMAGFGWEIGAFESWDVLGVRETAQKMKEAGFSVAPWVEEMLSKGISAFYRVEKGRRFYYSIHSGSYEPVAGGDAYIVMKNFQDATVWKNQSCRLYHLGDDVLGLEWYTKMGSIGADVLEGIQRSVAISEEKYKGLVIANEGPNFSAGANVGLIFMFAVEQDFDEMDLAIRTFQKTVTRVRYSAIPVVVATHGLTLGGSCELVLHSDKVCASAESYTGLVELGLGLIPAGAGTKEFVQRAADEMHEDEPETVTLKNRFLTIATAKVSTSAAEGFELGIFRKGTDEVVMNHSRRIAEARRSVIELFDSGYQQPVPRNDIKVLGRSALGALYAGIHGMWRAGYATDHDVLAAKKLAYVMCGGDLSEPSYVTEQYLLDLEREAFLSLSGERKTLERIQSVIKTGKPVRN